MDTNCCSIATTDRASSRYFIFHISYFNHQDEDGDAQAAGFLRYRILENNGVRKKNLKIIP
jgi:hypothetical protein